jgi:hypothetical protein
LRIGVILDDFRKAGRWREGLGKKKADLKRPAYQKNFWWRRGYGSPVAELQNGAFPSKLVEEKKKGQATFSRSPIGRRRRASPGKEGVPPVSKLPEFDFRFLGAIARAGVLVEFPAGL